MKSPLWCRAVAALACAWASLAAAQSGALQLTLLSPSTVRVGQDVSLQAVFQVEKRPLVVVDLPADPEPAPGVTFWQQAQQARSGETLMFNVDLFTSDGQLLTSDGFTLDEAASRLDGQATMRLRFAAPGRYTVQGELAYALTGSDPWWSQTASRDCQDTPTGWACSPWNSRLDGGETPFEAVGSLGNTALGQAITVLAVPEPGSRTLYTAAATGLLLVVISRQRRRRPAPAR